MEVAARILSTLMSVCVQMDSQVGEPSHQGFHLYEKIQLAKLLLVFSLMFLFI